MNDKRRQAIKELRTQLENCQAALDNLLDEEQEYYDNIPDNLKMSSRAINSELYISALEDCLSGLDDAIEELYNINN